MSLGFLAPWFLVGALAVGVPLLAHLRRLSVRHRVRFGAMEFLSPMPPRSSRRSWEDVALMGIRMGLIGLMAVAFSRPFFRGEAENSNGGGVVGRRSVVLLDLSGSMRREGVFEEARRGVERWVSEAAESADLEVFGFGVGVRSLVSSEQWSKTAPSERLAMVRGVLRGIEPTWERTRLDLALRVAAEVAAQHPGSLTEVVIVSDFAEGVGLSGLQGQSWPGGMRVRAHPVRGALKGGEEVHLEWVMPNLETISGEEPLRVRVVASDRFAGEGITLHRSEGMPGHWTVPVQAGHGRVVAVPGEVMESGYVGVRSVEASLDGVWVARGTNRPGLVVVGGDGQSKDPKWDRTYLLKAAQALGPSRAEVVEMEEMLPSREGGAPSLWLWSEWPTPEWSGRIRASVETGATAMVTLSNGRGSDRLSAELGGMVEVKGGAVEGASILGEVDRNHAVFAPFRVGPFSDFSGIRFWRHFPLVLAGDAVGGGVRILASFEGGQPALIEVPVGKGRYLVWASGWKPSESQWALSSRCVPFLSGVLDCATGGRVGLQQVFAGERVEVVPGTERLRREDGFVVEVGEAEIRLSEPGVYRMEPQGGTVVVNVAPEEKRRGWLEMEKLRAMGVPLEEFGEGSLREDVARRGGGDQPLEELESRQGGWRMVLWVVVLLAALETFWAARLSRKGERRSV